MSLPARFAFCLSMAVPVMAPAHPHVFIDATLGLDYDASGTLTQVAVEWAYDEFYSLLIIEELGLDPDGDGRLTPDELTALQGFDADWEAGFDGRLYLRSHDRPIALDPPREFAAQYQGGRLISGHVRPVAGALSDDQPLVIQVYDPEYYVQFSLPEPPTIAGAECAVDLRIGDPYAAADAYAQAVKAALDEGDNSSVDQELLIVDIGAVGADEARVTCASAQ